MYPELPRIKKNTTEISVFKGLNRTVNTGFSKVSTNSSSVYTECKDCRNVCSDDFPQLRTRALRTRLYTSKNIISNILTVNGGFVFISAEKQNGVKVCYIHSGENKTELSGVSADVLHNIVLFGNNIEIFPEKIEFNLSTCMYKKIEIILAADYDYTKNMRCFNSTYIWGELSIDKVAMNTTVPAVKKHTVTENASILSEINQTSYADDYITKLYTQEWKTGDSIETADGNSALFMCTEMERQKAAFGGKLKKFTEITSYYVKLSVKLPDNCAGLDTLFKVGDFIQISGMTDDVAEGWNEKSDYKDVINNNTFKLYDVGNNYIVIKAEITSSVPYTGSFTFSRTMPDNVDFDKIQEVGNRLWTCSSKNNEIYACKQGDVTNWKAYGDGIASDSFAMTVGSEGDFTGIARYNDSVIFFKENYAMRIYGTKPSNYTLSEYNLPGIEKGSEKSAVWLQGSLFYKSRRGIMAYGVGGQPTLISESAFGKVAYKNVVAGRSGDKYVASMQREDNGEYELLTYDVRTGQWFKEDETKLICTANYNDIMYYIDGESNTIMALTAEHNIIDDTVLDNGEEVLREGAFEWCYETGDLYDSDFDTKYISRVQLGLIPEQGTSVNIYAQYNDGGNWHKLSELLFDRKKPRIIPVALRRAEFIRIRIEGNGGCNIYGISITYSKGSDFR